MTIARLSQRLEWLKPTVKGLQFFLGEDKIDMGVNVEETADPISLLVTIPLKSPIAKASREAVRTFIRSHAQEGDCHVPRINITEHYIRMDVLIKYRHSKIKRFEDDSTDCRTGRSGDGGIERPTGGGSGSLPRDEDEDRGSH